MISWNSNKTRLIPFVVDGVAKTVFINNDKVYGNVKVYDVIGNEVSVTKALNTNGTTIVIKQGDAVVAMYRHENGSFNVLESDGKAGTYTSDDAYGDIVLDGFGSLTINGKSVSYVIDGDKVTFIVDNAMRVITLSGNTYVKTQDSYQGTYTLPDGSTMELDGYGNVTGTTKTYVVSGSTIAIYEGETSSSYGIDVDGKAFRAKSAFAGLKFEKTSSDYVEFEDGVDIKGIMYCGSIYWYINFTGAYDAENKILTLTVVSESGTGAKVGQTISFTVSDGKLVLNDVTPFEYVNITKGYTYTNSTFKA